MTLNWYFLSGSVIIFTLSDHEMVLKFAIRCTPKILLQGIISQPQSKQIFKKNSNIMYLPPFSDILWRSSFVFWYALKCAIPEEKVGLLQKIKIKFIMAETFRLAEKLIKFVKVAILKWFLSRIMVKTEKNLSFPCILAFCSSLSRGDQNFNYV